ncbi:hypothetical protein L198_02759 [Cryptococcus wingfieldii CBS 7118]|uniref:Syntaxin n=1 Tax=Cryptococcus wingfieldii CBS 7118 TaxID=1295528 RepID=A0A1E3JME2_9TREE|nr:hypothetical protein L198_02759 [Cryptococcus wingfieldii CBS 7118]ODO02028.1 hypothetical protein L198_02759 [Cryptococcus wingfieldii CBS 7118]
MSDIRDISVISTKQLDSPKPHTVYIIQITTPTRSWTVTRRYNDFVDLHTELKSSTGSEPPAGLPPKTWGLAFGKSNEEKVRQRKPLLELYLRTILNTKNPLWRTAYTFSDFLSVPSHSTTASAPGQSGGLKFTPQSWMLEHGAIQTLLRTSRSSLLKRDALASMSNASGSRSAAVEAKRHLKEVDAKLDVLEKGLKSLQGLGEGEARRREEMVEGLKVERQTLGRMAEAGVRTAAPPGGASLGGARDGSSNPWAPAGQTIPGALPSGRVFGSKAPPQETEQTRPLDDRQLLQYQNSNMEQQDEQLRGLSRLLQTQRRMGEEIHVEIESQNELLEGIEQGVDRTGKKVGKAKREMNRLG